MWSSILFTGLCKWKENEQGKLFLKPHLLLFCCPKELIQIPEKSFLANKFSTNRNANREIFTWQKRSGDKENDTISDCLVCKLLSRKRILCIQTLHFFLINPIGAEHSQKVAINTKITLLNNKYISECGGIDFSNELSNVQLLTDQLNFRLITQV